MLNRTWWTGLALSMVVSGCVGEVSSSEEELGYGEDGAEAAPDDRFTTDDGGLPSSFDPEEEGASANDGDDTNDLPGSTPNDPVSAPEDPSQPMQPPAAGEDPDDAEPAPTPPPAPPPPAPPPAPSSGCGNAVETEELGLTNQARGEAGLGALSCDPLLTQVARAHSNDMCTNNYFSHTGLNGSSFGDRIKAAGGSFRTGGENIARGQRTATAVHTAWMNSSGHRANILNKGYGRIGIGYVECGGSPVWTQVFTN